MTADPDGVLLDRVDPHRNMARFHRLDIVPDLSGGAVLVRDGGRIGRRGQERRQRFARPTDAAQEQAARIGRKTGRGHKVVG